MDPRRRNLIVIVVVAVIVVAGVGGYFALKKYSPPATCSATERSTICIDQAETIDSLDPAETFSTPGWAAVQQVYQGLVNYNGSSSTNFAGVLAQNWTTGPLTWTFTLRTGVHFSNGDPYNAYVQWYSFYRSLLVVGGPQFILEQNFFSTNFSASNPLSYYSTNTTSDAANATLLNDLNTWNFTAPTPSEIALMETANQSFQVLNANTIELNLGYGYLGTNYTYLLASISAPNSYAVDPIWVDAHGGVQLGQPNDYMSYTTLGTGQYTLSGYSDVSGGGYTLTPDPNYWGTTAARAEPWNNMIQPANTSVQIIFQNSIDVTTNDLISGTVQGASFAYTGAATISSLSGHPNVVVQPLPTVYGATSGSWWVFLNQSVAPFNNLSVREAVAHAINYTQIIQQAFGGDASQWVGPVPPSYPYYNPAGLSPYTYNLTLARAEIADSPCAGGACASTSISYEYLTTGLAWSETAQFLATDLRAIGLTINPVPISLPNLLALQALETVNGQTVCTSSTAAYGGPFYMGQEFYTSDYISPDDWTQNNAINYGSANLCMAGYNNGTMNGLVLQAAGESNSANLTADYTQMTNLMYNNYTDIWLVVPTAFAVYSSNLHGIIQNPMASAEPFAMLFNTQWLS